MRILRAMGINLTPNSPPCQPWLMFSDTPFMTVDDARAAAQGASATGPRREPLLAARAVPQRPAPRRIPLRPLRAAHRPGARRKAGREGGGGATPGISPFGWAGPRGQPRTPRVPAARGPA